ncbi:PmbA/TldA family metallopeptidase [Sulfidibacter corallicola]|uniref:Metalloprotease TldD/E N-terminal domain-containing protein n=1 Tax=Sulfidibacter corallicola TaxID=2818388 RepID=A0A8A4TGH6_SULCO|nr:DNA gyrase modulator [Sulfidibacter corallicola]QTD48282.1 hypothetical protein J3U87_22105 [Sulfidibacter corallicola]
MNLTQCGIDSKRFKWSAVNRIVGDTYRFSCQGMEVGILKKRSSSLEEGMGIRVVKGERTGHAYAEYLNNANFPKISYMSVTVGNRPFYPHSGGLAKLSLGIRLTVKKKRKRKLKNTDIKKI